MGYRVGSLAVCVALVAVLGAQQSTKAVKSASSKEVQREKFDPKRDPQKDLESAIKLAKKDKKRILLDVGGEWCIWCHKLDEFFATDKDAKEALNKNYVVVKVNYSEDNKNEKFLSKYPKISGYPHLFVLEGDGKLLHSQDTGLLETGDKHDHDKVMAFLNKWAPKK